MCTVPCYMEVYFCTLLTRRAQMESSGKLTPTLIWHPLPPVSSCIHTRNTPEPVSIGLVWQCPVWSFPHVIPNGAGWRSVLHRQRTGRIWASLFFYRKKAFLLPCYRTACSVPAVKHVDTLALQALDLVPTKIHERSPIFLGSYDDVEEIKALFAEHAKSSSAWSGNPNEVPGSAVTWFRVSDISFLGVVVSL